MTSNETPTFDIEALRNDLTGGGSVPYDWGLRVEKRRMMLRLTKAQLARMCDTTRQTIGHIEAGQIAPRAHVRFALCAALNAEMSELFPLPPLDTIGERYPLADIAVAS